MAKEIIAVDVIRTEENGIEYFTVAATGESAVSERGLAKMCGVTHRTIQKLLLLLGYQNAPKMFEKLTGQELYLATKIVKRGKEIKPIRANVAAVIIRYYDRQGRQEAQETADAIAEIGLASFIQSKTGWLPEKYTAAPEAHKTINRILDEPRAWERLYHPEMCKRAFSWFGSQFYWDFFYQWMTVEERCKLERVNPAVKGDRAFRIHQFIEDDTRERLKPRAIELAALVGSNHNKNAFLTAYTNLYGQGWQQELTV